MWALAACQSPAPQGGAVPAPLQAVCPQTPQLLPATPPPAPWTPQERAAALEQLAAAPVAQSIPVAAPPAPWWEPTEGRELLTPGTHYRSTRGTPPPEGAAGTRVDVHDMLLQGPPALEVTPGGMLVLTFKTIRPVVAGTVFWGGYPPDQEVSTARLRFNARSTPDDSGLLHRAELPLGKMLSPRYDPAATARTGAGRLGWQLELWDETQGSARLFTGTAAFACSPTPCTKGATFGRLPAATGGPMVDLPTRDGATITLDSDVPTAAAVWWRSSDGQTGFAVSAVAGTRHEIPVTGIAADAYVRYHVALRDSRGATSVHPGGAFRVAPTAPRPVRLAFMSDGRGGYGAGEQSVEGVNLAMTRGLLNDALRAGADAAFFFGDLVNGYTSVPADLRRQLEAWQRAVAPVGAHLSIFESMGNHEQTLKSWASGWQSGYQGEESSEGVFAERFCNPRNAPTPTEPGEPSFDENVYSVDYGPVHVAVVNTNHWFRSHLDRADHPGGPGGRREGELAQVQLDWLDRDLAAARERGARHLVVGTHEPAFPAGGHTGDAMYWGGKIPAMLEMRDRFWAILVEHEVLVTFYGDEHNYQRLRVDSRLDPRWTRPVWHVVSGGVGAPYYARNESLPWSPFVEVFSVQQHFVMVTFDDDSAWLEAWSATGQLLDRVDLVAERDAVRE